MSKIEKLERLTWTNNTPNIMHSSAAYTLPTHKHRFYMVTWTREEPSGFSQFEFTGVISGAYEIKLINERDTPITALEADEWVLVFQHA